MENNINDKVKDYVLHFKTNICNLIQNTDLCLEKRHEMISYVNTYPLLHIDKSEFIKRKRIKNIVPYYDRCIAKIANMEQCTRRKKKDSVYCGTHCKGRPHGDVDKNDTQTNFTQVVVFVKDIKGIQYYIDDNNNVYKTEDIVENKTNPRVIAKYVVLEDGTYTIPELNI